jgi:hypothetical protein
VSISALSSVRQHERRGSIASKLGSFEEPGFLSIFDSALTVMHYVALLLLSFFRAGGIKEAKGVEVCRPRTCDVYVASNINSSHSFIFSSLAPVQSPEAMSNEPEKQIDESSEMEMEDTPVWYVDQAFDPSQFDGLVSPRSPFRLSSPA